jgi:SAM-dependent methyltransferase
MEDFFTLPHQEVRLPKLDAEGWVLDIGGGGEGIIGLLHDRRVVAIDTSRRELEETTNDSLKIVMDACDLKFLDGTFDVVTSFFALMYVPGDKWGDVFGEAHRVLVDGGQFLIWDARFHVPASVDKDISVIQLTVVFPDGRSVETGYGCKIHDQDLEDFRDLAGESGFEVLESDDVGEIFFLRLRKPSG